MSRAKYPDDGGEAPARCDLVLRGGWVIDGSGAKRVRADVAVVGERIVAVGELSRTVAAREVSAEGRIVAPGFIDVHSHDDPALISAPLMAPKASQGVTTVVAGNCGISLAPLRLKGWPPPPLDLLGDGAGYRFREFGDFARALEAAPPAVNAALLVGHITLRYRHMKGGLERPAGEGELAAMEDGVRDAMAAGATGFSTGLDFAQALAAPSEEVTVLARAAGACGGIYASHTRNYFETVEEAVDEALAIGREAEVPVILSHHQVSGQANFGKSLRTLARIARAMGDQPVGLDAYPYAASSKVLDPARCAPGLRVLVTWSEPHPGMAGREIADIAADWNCADAEAARRLLPAGAVYFQLSEDDVRRVLAFPHTMIGSDGLPSDVHPHPRLWGTFPRVLGHYARDLGLFTLEEAVRRMTGLPAARFGLSGRGAIRPGAFADLVVFDASRILDRATFEHPTRPAQGVERVFVNGIEVWSGDGDGGRASGARPGRFLTGRMTGSDGA